MKCYFAGAIEIFIIIVVYETEMFRDDISNENYYLSWFIHSFIQTHIRIQYQHPFLQRNARNRSEMCSNPNAPISIREICECVGNSAKKKEQNQFE